MPAEKFPALTVYSRNDCHLCEEMIAGLRVLQGRVRFDLHVADVGGEPELERRYGERVPVLAHGERVLCQHVLEPAAVTAYLERIR